MVISRPALCLVLAMLATSIVALFFQFQKVSPNIDSVQRFSGIASMYDEDTETASGEPFDKHAMTAAHRTLPFGTRLKVILGDRSVLVRVNDRGPFHGDRIIDLSSGAAKVLGLDGISQVTVEVQ